MAKEEVAQRLFYVDKLYDERKFSNKSPEEVKKIINIFIRLILEAISLN